MINSGISPDQFLGQRQDTDRLAHVEDEDLPTLADAPRLHDELRGLGDGHEIAHDVAVGDGDRSPRGSSGRTA